MTHTPTKNSETLKAIEERLNATPEPHEPNFTFGQRAYILRIVKEAMGTRAPERGEGQETGINWENENAPQSVWDALESGGIKDVLQAVGDWAYNTALSRQSAVSGDWEKELSDLVDQASGMESVTGAAAWVVLQAKRILRRALRATRTFEGEMCCRICIENISTDPNMRICQSCYDEHSAEPGFIEAVSGKTSPPRPTATGGITVEDVRFLLRLMPKWALEDEPGLDPTMYGTLSYEGDREVIERVRKIAALIERAGEEGE